ncbi:MAG TPA: sodium:solute symporter family protein [Candidatus Polarisedimenticolaceae bacterium]|nr:sodium:solute symporter family protein [Candidatus Polarisedimenticolaceae bacterium]
MPSWVIVFAVAVVYLALSLLVGMHPGRRATKTASGFVAGDRSLGLFVMYFITGATIFSAFAFLGAPGWVYSRGAAAFYILAYGCLAFLPFYFLGPRAARLGRRFGFVTQAEMVAERYGSRALAGLMALVSVLGFIPYLALQMKGAGYVLASVTRGHVPEWLGAAIVYGVVLIYVMRSGVLGVGWTNTFQGILMMGLAWGLGLYLPYELYGGVGPMFDAIAETRPELLRAPGLAASGESWSWGEYGSAVVISIVGFSVWPHLFMKAFTARDDRTIRRTVVLYPTFQLFLVPLFLIGFSGVLFNPAPSSPDQILPHMLMQMELPAVLVGLFCAGALAASMSSGDAMAHAAASIAVRDGVVTTLGVSLDERQQRDWIRVGVVLSMIAAYVLTVSYDKDLVALLLYAYGPIGQFAPVVFATLYSRRATGAGVFAGLLAGSLVTIVLDVRPDWRPWPIHAGVYGLVANLVTLAIVSAATPQRRDAGREDRYLDVAAGRSTDAAPAALR